MSAPLRVLLVPDVPYWICGAIARAIAAHTPGIDATVCSGPVLRALPELGSCAGHFDVVHFLTPQDANKTIQFFSGRVPTVTTIHHVQDESSTRSLDRADAVMTASRQWYGRLRESGVGPEKLDIVPYGIDTAQFHPPLEGEKFTLRAALGLDSDRFTIGFVGKRSSDAGGRKGTETFAQGLRLLVERGSDLQVLMVGPGWDDFVASLQRLGVRCVWKPFIADERDFASLYRAMDVYACTSTIEGGPVPVLEAMASGVCCLATEVGMVPEVIRHGENGFIIPFNDPQAFARQIEVLRDDRERCADLGLAGAATIAQGYRWDQSAPHATELYRTALRNFAGRPDRLPANPAQTPWPAAWITAEERRMTEAFIRDAHHPPGLPGRVFRHLRNSRHLRNWLARRTLR